MKRIIVLLLSATLLLTNISMSTTSMAKSTTTSTTSDRNSTESNSTDTNSTESNSPTSDETTEVSKQAESTFDWPSGPSIDSEAAVLMEANTGLVLYEKKAHKELYPASITKIMTTLIALENSSFNEIVTFSHNAVYSIEAGSTHIGMKENEQLTMEQCLYAIMLASANEVSNAVAEHIAGDIDSFADLMNAKAKELGCKNTHFVNANGLHNDNHYTSAYDMALISKEALKNETFRKITATKSYVIPSTNITKQERPIATHQQLLLGYKLTDKYDPCIGGKTGYTDTAHNTLVSFAERDGIELICVVMRTTPICQYSDTVKLFNFGFNNYTAHSINSKDQASADNNSMLFTRYNSILDKDNPIIHTSSNNYFVLPNHAKAKDVKQSIDMFETPKVRNGNSIIGQITYSFDNKTVGAVDIYYEESTKPSLEVTSHDISEDTDPVSNTATQTDSKRDLKPIIIIAIIVVFCLLYGIYFFIIERPRRRRRKAYYQKRKSRHFKDSLF